MKLPHYALVAVSLAIAIVAWLMNSSANGTLVLPAVVLTVLPLVASLLGTLSASAVPSVNLKAVKKADPGALVSKLVPPLSMLCLVIGLPLLSCHESPAAVSAQVVDLTNAICSLAPDSPVDAPLVEVICALVQGGEQVVSVAIGQLSDAGLGATATVKADHVLYRFPMPAAAAPAFLAAHKGH